VPSLIQRRQDRGKPMSLHLAVLIALDNELGPLDDRLRPSHRARLSRGRLLGYSRPFLLGVQKGLVFMAWRGQERSWMRWVLMDWMVLASPAR
jgi:hypothetical protein